jgi:hypothetical protein
MKKLYDIEITVCPKLIAEQKTTLVYLTDWLEKNRLPKAMLEHLDGLINLLDAIDDQINNIAN